jgi:DNA-binding PadR family transcriptional regulator
MFASMLSDIELTILSLVAEGARYGAEIEQQIELRGVREWLTVGSASVYYTLGRLEQQELVSSAAQNGETDLSRTVYQITDAGRGVAQTAVADLLCEPRVLGGSFALGLANSSILKPTQVELALTQHLERLTNEFQATQAFWARRQRDAQPPGDNIRALYTHGIAVMQAELDWLTAFIDDWRLNHPVEVDVAHMPADDTGDVSVAKTILHRPTDSLDQGKQMQQLKRPGQPPLEQPREE